MATNQRGQSSRFTGIVLFGSALTVFVALAAVIILSSSPLRSWLRQVSLDTAGINNVAADAPVTAVSLGSANITELTGEVTLDATGLKTITAGDVNNDGYDDFLIASKTNDDTGLNAGAAYLVYGRSTVLTSESLSGSANTVSEFTGEAPSDYAGTIVGPAGDVNNDGYADFLITAYQPGPGVGNGLTYLIYGKAETFASQVSLGAAGIIKFTGEAVNDAAGAMANGVGDVNNDGYDDFMIGATANDDTALNAGAAYLIYGQAADLVSANLSTAVEFAGEATSDGAGVSISGGDFNNDGYSDMLISAATYAANNLGRTYLFYGKAEAFTSANLSTADAMFTGEVAEDASGINIDSAGDVNNDTYDDILIASAANDDAGTGAGAAYLIYGQAAALASASLSTAVEFTGEAAGDAAGNSVSRAGDINADGYDDFLIGAPLNNDAASDAGAAYLIYGKAETFVSASLSTFVEYTGEAASDRSGNSVSAGGDINNDGYNDILISSRLSDDGAVDAGALYIVYYQPPTVSLSAATQTVAESVASGTVTAQLALAFPYTVTVPYTVSGTATGGGTDYTLANGNITIPVGSTSGDVSFTIFDDFTYELDETMIVTIGRPSYGTLSGTTVQTITITNNDNPSKVIVNPATTAVKTVTVLTPMIATEIVEGDDLSVTWQYTGIIPAVNIYLSTDGGTSWKVMKSNIANEGVTLFSAPFVTTSQALVKVEGTDLATVLATGISDPFYLLKAAGDVPLETIVIPETPTGSVEVATEAETLVANWPGSVRLDTLIKIRGDGDETTTYDAVVYALSADGYRHAFPSESVYFTWYSSFEGITKISAADMAKIKLGSNVTYRPGVKMVKFITGNKVYAVDRGGVLRWVTTEAAARVLYGNDWNTKVDDISDALFASYSFGPIINGEVDYDPNSFTDVVNPGDSLGD
ncbi:TPA: hypothetical protein DEP96_04350 [Candidatus Uhrbacteria bacterium]|nr:hypothetical protein [Candidatus Uhrbacteria bacterium]